MKENDYLVWALGGASDKQLPMQSCSTPALKTQLLSNEEKQKKKKKKSETKLTGRVLNTRLKRRLILIKD